MNLSVISQKKLPQDASYPVHWNQWLFYTVNNTLLVSQGDKAKQLKICDVPDQSYLPVIIPPMLYILPCKSPGNIFQANILSLIDSFQSDDLDMSLFSNFDIAVRAFAELPPAVWFKPGDAKAGKMVVFWEDGCLKLWDVANGVLLMLYSFHGLLNSISYTPCFDEEGNVWLADSANQALIKFARGQNYTATKHEYEGIMSAPIYAKKNIYFYQTRDNETLLVRHPEFPVLKISKVGPEQFPQHLSDQPGDHPGYLVSAKLTGVNIITEIDQNISKSVHPVWIQLNKFNAMIMAYK